MEVQASPNSELDGAIPAEIDSVEGQRNPYPWYKTLQENDPVRYDEDRKRWDIFRYDDVEQILMDPDTFVSSVASDFDPHGAFEAPVFGDTDSPDHERQRGLVDEFFRPGKLRDFRPAIREHVDTLLDDALEDGSTIDIATDLSKPTTLWAISKILGVPTKHMDQLTELLSGLLDEREEDEPIELAVDGETYGPGSYDAVVQYFTEYLLKERARNPQDACYRELPRQEIH